MYNQTYEDYMRSVLGYSTGNDTCGCATYENQCAQGHMQMQQQTQPTPYQPMNGSAVNVACTIDIEEMYPDVYRIVNPMVCKICDENTKPITKECIMEMVETICSVVEPNDNEMVRTQMPELKNGDVRNPNVKTENRGESRQNNYLLRDLVLIMLLNRLGGGRPPRPPFPGPGMPPPRPPFPGGPGHGRPPRPQPRDRNDFIY